MVKIRFVDDSPTQEMWGMIEDYLRENGYEFEVVSMNQEGLLGIELDPPEVVLVEITPRECTKYLMRASGLEFIEEILRRNPQMKVIALMATVTDELLEELKRLGVEEHIDKLELAMRLEVLLETLARVKKV